MLNDFEILLGYKEFILIWNLVTGLCSHSINAHEGEVYYITKLNYNQILSGGSDTLIKLWTKNLKENTFFNQRTFTGHTSAVLSIIKLNKSQIASGCDDSLRIWDLENGQCLITITSDNSFVHLEKINKYFFVFAGGRIDDFSNYYYIEIMDTITGDCIYTINGHTSQIINLKKFNVNMLISASSEGTIKIWCTKTWTCLKQLDVYIFSCNSFIVINNNSFATLFLDNIEVWKLKSDYTINNNCEFESNYIEKGDAQVTLARINDSQILSIDTSSLKIQVININT